MLVLNVASVYTKGFRVETKTFPYERTTRGAQYILMRYNVSGNL